MKPIKHYDVAVVGGGFAGATAAIAAARQGKHVLLIEKYNALGGAAVYDLVNPFMAYWTWTPEEDRPKEKILLSRGIFEEIVERLTAEGGMITDMVFNEEILKYVLNAMALESGVQLLYQTYVTGILMDGERIRSVTVSNVSGTEEIEADVFIDATGDANLATMAGCPFTLGRESDHLCQPMTLCFRLANVNSDDVSDTRRRINLLYKQYQAEGKIQNPRENILSFSTSVKSIWHFNTTRVIKLDPTNAEEVTKAEIIAREQVMELYRFLHENFEEFRESVLVSTGLQIGVRESRMIDGEYKLTQEDLISCKKFEDGIAASCYDIDIHSPDGSGTSHYYFPHGEYYTIPYRCLVPKKASNLLVTGRCVSATHEAQASLRIMPVCATLGEAAGIGASLMVESGCAAKDVDVSRLRALLVQNGAVVD